MTFTMKYPDNVKGLILNGGNLNPKGVKRTIQIPIEIGYRIARRFASISPDAAKNAEIKDTLRLIKRLKTFCGQFSSLWFALRNVHYRIAGFISRQIILME